MWLERGAGLNPCSVTAVRLGGVLLTGTAAPPDCPCGEPGQTLPDRTGKQEKSLYGNLLSVGGYSFLLLLLLLSLLMLFLTHVYYFIFIFCGIGAHLLLLLYQYLGALLALWSVELSALCTQPGLWRCHLGHSSTVPANPL